MGVCNDDIVDITGIEIQLSIVPFIPALLKAAVDEYLTAARLHAVTASGNRLGRAKKGQFHEAPPHW